MEMTSRRMTLEEAERFRRDDAAFRKSNQMMCDRRDELVQQYPDQWVGLHHSLGVLHSDTYQGIYQELKDHQFPEAQTAIALLEKNPRIMIL